MTDKFSRWSTLFLKTLAVTGKDPDMASRCHYFFWWFCPCV